MGDTANAGASGTKGVFRIGLTMAGAISGGAYTAGVLDFLFEALHEWEAEKRKPDSTAPNHDVVVTAVTGASAGSICAALLPIALAKREAPKEYNTYYGTVRAFLPTLYEAWVVRPTFVNNNDGNELFGRADIDALDETNANAKKPVAPSSLLDTTILDEIACSAVSRSAGQTTIPLCPNLSKTLHTYITLGNLRGVPYKIDFPGDSVFSAHGMRLHADRAHVVFEGAGSAAAQAGPYTSEPVDLTVRDVDLPAKLVLSDVRESDTGFPGSVWGRFVAITLGSAAFPAALRTRRIVPGAVSYSGRSFPLDVDVLFEPAKPAKIKPAWDTEYDPDLTTLLGPAPADGTYEYRSVDGGTFNNEPFEIARFCLFDSLHPAEKRRNPRDPRRADRAVLMIDPFPEPASVDPRSWKPEIGLLDALLAFPGAFKNQARFKAEDLALTLDETVFSRFLVAPSRRDSNGAHERFALACGLLGGFGGFLDRRLRDHDFALGRANCRRFLETHFVLHKDNPVFGGQGASADARMVLDAKDQIPIVPLYGSAAPPIPPLDWPRVHVDTVRRFAEKAGARIDLVAGRLAQTVTGVLGTIVRIVSWAKANSFVRTRAYQIAQADLLRRDQLDLDSDRRLAGLTGTSPAERLILAAFCDSGERWRTSMEIAEAAGFPNPESAADQIEKVADKFAGFVEASGSAGTRKFRTKLYWEAPKPARPS